MIIKRDEYIKKLNSKRNNGLIKIITGIRRCGKSFLLFKLFSSFLISDGINEKNIIKIDLEDTSNLKLRNPLELDREVREQILNKGESYYILIDEIQRVQTIQNPYTNIPSDTVGFVDVLLGLSKIENVDIYVTGSNSKFLSTDVITEFRGRGDEVRLNPLTFKEYTKCMGNKKESWNEYMTFGGLPYVLTLEKQNEKIEYLKNLFLNIYINDIVERHSLLKDESVLLETLKVLSSSVGSLTNAKRICNTFSSKGFGNLSQNTVTSFFRYFEDSFLLYGVSRYDVKGRKYIGAQSKYYFSDIGLRNALLNFRQNEEGHIMENILYTELLSRGYAIDIGVVEYNYKDEKMYSKSSQLEIDFVINKGSARCYIQSVLNIDDEEKRIAETKPFSLVKDSFKKIVVLKDDIIPHYDDEGIYYVGIKEFLLNDAILS